MNSSFLVFSGNWRVKVQAEDFVEAALIGTKDMLDLMAEFFEIGLVISVVEEKTNEVELFCPSAVFQDIGEAKLSADIKQFLDLYIAHD